MLAHTEYSLLFADAAGIERCIRCLCGTSPSWERGTGLAGSEIPRRQGWEELLRSARPPSCPQAKEKEHLG